VRERAKDINFSVRRYPNNEIVLMEIFSFLILFMALEIYWAEELEIQWIL
jgi:hypothetical protein